jgi:hypothetical protein
MGGRSDRYEMVLVLLESFVPMAVQRELWYVVIGLSSYGYVKKL